MREHLQAHPVVKARAEFFDFVEKEHFVKYMSRQKSYVVLIIVVIVLCCFLVVVKNTAAHYQCGLFSSTC